MSRDTQPAALLLLSGAVIASGGAAYALHRALIGFWTRAAARPPVSDQTREFLEREKALALRSIKELEFDYAMRKVSDVDFAEMFTRSRWSERGLSRAEIARQLRSKGVADEIAKKVDVLKMEQALMQEGTEKFTEPHKKLLKQIADKRQVLAAK